MNSKNIDYTTLADDKELTKAHKLKSIATYGESSTDRLNAVEQLLSNYNALAFVAQNSPYNNVADRAIELLNGSKPETLVSIGRYCEIGLRRSKIYNMLKNEPNLLLGILDDYVDRGNGDVAEIISYLPDEYRIKVVLNPSYPDSFAMEALSGINDNTLLHEIIVDSNLSLNIRSKAFERIEDPKVLKEIVLEIDNKDLEVRYYEDLKIKYNVNFGTRSLRSAAVLKLKILDPNTLTEVVDILENRNNNRSQFEEVDKILPFSRAHNLSTKRSNGSSPISETTTSSVGISFISSIHDTQEMPILTGLNAVEYTFTNMPLERLKRLLKNQI